MLDPILTRSKSLYPDNYQRYHRACRDGSLQVGSCLLYKRQQEHTGLGASPNSNQPTYIANLIVSDHPYHPPRKLWLKAALSDLQQQLMPLIRYKGVRKMSVLSRPLIFNNNLVNENLDSGNFDNNNLNSDNSKSAIDRRDKSTVNTANVPLDWHSATLPLLIKYLQHMPKLRIELHLPKSVAIHNIE